MADLLKDILDNLGEDAAVLWDAAGITIDPDFKIDSTTLINELCIENKWSPFGIPCVLYRGRFIAAWVCNKWVPRDNHPYGAWKAILAVAQAGNG